MQMMPKISWPHRVASDAVARSTGALDATAMIFLPAYLASRRSWVADGSAKCAINLCSLHRLSAQGEYLVIRYYRAAATGSRRCAAAMGSLKQHGILELSTFRDSTLR